MVVIFVNVVERGVFLGLPSSSYPLFLIFKLYGLDIGIFPSLVEEKICFPRMKRGRLRTQKSNTTQYGLPGYNFILLSLGNIRVIELVPLPLSMILSVGSVVTKTHTPTVVLLNAVNEANTRKLSGTVYRDSKEVVDLRLIFARTLYIAGEVQAPYRKVFAEQEVRHDNMTMDEEMGLTYQRERLFFLSMFD